MLRFWVKIRLVLMRLHFDLLPNFLEDGSIFFQTYSIFPPKVNIKFPAKFDSEFDTFLQHC